MALHINGIGAAVPRRVVSNEAFAMLTGLDPQWIAERTGVTRRYLSFSVDAARRLAGIAARQALAEAQVLPEDVTLLVVASTCHAKHAPVFNASDLRHELGLRRAYAVDVRTARTGFLDALAVATALLAEGDPGEALVLGAEAFSAVDGMQDRRKCYMYSEAAGAWVLSHRPGFATLGALRTAHLAGEAGTSSQTTYVPLNEEALITLPLAQQQGADVTRAMLQHLAPARREQPLYLLSQDMGADATCDLGQGIDVYNPFPQTGHFLSASAPLFLYQLLCDKAVAPGTDVLLVAHGTGGSVAGACLRMVSPRRLSQPEEVGGGTGEMMRSGRSVAVYAADELRERLKAAAAEVDPRWGPLIGLALRMAFDAAQPERLAPLIEHEAGTILASSIRQHDVLLQLEGQPAYVLLLRYVSAQDAAKLGKRLSSLLEDVDPAGEFKINVACHCATFDAPAGVAETADDLVRFVTADPAEGP